MHGGTVALVIAMVGAVMLAFNGQALAEGLDLPIVLKPYKHEAAQFGYAPWYTQNEPGFDSYNRPYIRSRGADEDETSFIHTLRHGRWVEKDFTAAIRSAYPTFTGFKRAGGSISSRVVFDADDHLYTLLRIALADGSTQNVLLYSQDYGDTFQAYELPQGEFWMEYWVGHNTLNRPPLIGIFTTRATHPARYATYNDFVILQPEKQDGKLILPEEPLLVTHNSLGMTRHSGEATFAVSTGEKTFITWAEATPDNGEGAPTYVTTFYPATGKLGEKHLVGFGPPANDGHNTPGIVVDSQGYLHVVTGAHGMNFYYTKSLAPKSADAGWSKPVPVLETGFLNSSGQVIGRQSYVALVCDSDDTLHLVFRQWRQGQDPFFYGELYGALSYQNKPANGEWSKEAQQLVVPPVTNYSIYYHKLAMDRLGRLFLSYSYRSNAGLYYETMPGLYHYRAVIMSDDGGASWKLATTEDFQAGIAADAPDSQGSPASLSGKVTDEQGQPVVGATVTVGTKTVETNGPGAFRFPEVFADEVEVTIAKTGFLTWRENLSLAGTMEKQLVVTLAQEDIAPISQPEAWQSGLKLGAKVDAEESRVRIDYARQALAVVAIPLPFSDGSYRYLRFEARLITAGSRELAVTVDHEGGRSTVSCLIESSRSTCEVPVTGGVKRLSIGLSGGAGGTVLVEDLRLVKAD